MPPNHGQMGARGRHASGSKSASWRSWRVIIQQCTGRWPPLIPATKISWIYLNVSLNTINVSFKKLFVFELQWILLIFAFWPRQETRFELLSAKKMFHHTPTAHTLPLDAFLTIRVAAVLACSSPNWLWKQNRERRIGEREKKRKGRRERERGEREKWRQQIAHSSPSLPAWV